MWAHASPKDEEGLGVALRDWHRRTTGHIHARNRERLDVHQ
jgi:hypothetical protein